MTGPEGRDYIFSFDPVGQPNYFTTKYTVKNGLMCTRFNVQVAFLGTCPVLIAKVTFFDTTAD